MIILQVAGRNFQALDGSLPREGWLARLAAPLLLSPNKKTGAPAGMERYPGRRIAQCAILTESVPSMAVVLSIRRPFSIPMVSPFWKFVFWV